MATALGDAGVNVEAIEGMSASKWKPVHLGPALCAQNTITTENTGSNPVGAT